MRTQSKKIDQTVDDAGRSISISPIWYYLLIITLSLIANWFVQLGYYFYKVHINTLAFSGERTLADYTTGFIGDALLLPVMNAAILFVILKSKIRLVRRDFCYIVPIGLVADILLHFLQGYLKLTNWSMPRPFQWDFVSYWHMVSFFFQISFVFLFLYVVVRHMFRRDLRQVLQAVWLVFGIMGLFVMLFLYDYGPIHRPVQLVEARLVAYINYLR
jgi:hypothetical protein